MMVLAYYYKSHMLSAQLFSATSSAHNTSAGSHMLCMALIQRVTGFVHNKAMCSVKHCYREPFALYTGVELGGVGVGEGGGGITTTLLQRATSCAHNTCTGRQMFSTQQFVSFYAMVNPSGSSEESKYTPNILSHPAMGCLETGYWSQVPNN